MLPWSLDNRISLKILFTYRDEGVSFGALQITMEFQFRLVHSSAEVLGDSLYSDGERRSSYPKESSSSPSNILNHKKDTSSEVLA